MVWLQSYACLPDWQLVVVDGVDFVVVFVMVSLCVFFTVLDSFGVPTARNAKNEPIHPKFRMDRF